MLFFICIDGAQIVASNDGFYVLFKMDMMDKYI